MCLLCSFILIEYRSISGGAGGGGGILTVNTVARSPCPFQKKLNSVHNHFGCCTSSQSDLLVNTFLQGRRKRGLALPVSAGPGRAFKRASHRMKGIPGFEKWLFNVKPFFHVAPLQR